MRTTKKMLCILLSCILLLCTACSGGAENSGDNAGSVSDSEHAYEEYKIAVLPKMTGKYGYGYAGGRLYVLGADEELSLILMSSTDGITWEDISSSYASAIQNALGEGEALLGVAISEKEALAWVANKAESETGSVNTIHVTDKNGTDTVVGTMNTSIKKLLFSKDGETLFVCTKEEITAYGLDGNKKGNIQTSEYIDACAKEDGSVAVLKSQGICVYSLDGKMTGMEEGIAKTLPDELAKLNEHIESDVLTWYSGFQYVGEYYYLLLESGIYKYKSGVLIERLVTQERALFKENASGIYALLVKDDELFVLAGADKETAYVYTPEAQEMYVVELTTEQTTEEAVAEPELKESPDGELTLYSLFENNDIVDAVDSFSANHPNVTVHLEVGIPLNSGITVNDAVQALNVKLLSGNGPDVLLLDGLNIDKYIENGMLLNLSDIYDNLKNNYPNIFNNIMNAFRRENNQLYAIPARFSASILIGKDAALNKITDINSIYDFLTENGNCKKGNELQIFYPEELFEVIEPAYIKTIIDSTGEYHEENLKELMLTLKNIWQLLAKETSTEEQREADEIMDDTGAIWANMSSAINNIIGTELGNLDEPSNQIALGSFNQGTLADSISVIINEIDSYRMRPFSATENKVYEPQYIFSIASTTKEPEAAKCFIEEMFRLDVQSGVPWIYRYLKGGIPIRYADITYDDKYYGEIYGYNMEFGALSGDKKQYFIDFFKELDTPVYIDRTVEEIIEQDIGKYLNGEMSIEDYMKSVNERLNLYLKE